MFPQKDRLKAAIRRAIEQSIFHGGTLALKKTGPRTQLVIRYSATSGGPANVELPFLEWSAGQREFTPLLLGLYGLLPAGKIAKHTDYRWAIIEEPEMGLHPKAINAVMLLISDLLARGYKVCVSTHSSYILELVWAFRALSKSKSMARARAVLAALDVKDNSLEQVAGRLLVKKFAVHALTFDKNGAHVCTDISSLDFESANEVVAGWGGIVSLSSLVSSAVAKGM